MGVIPWGPQGGQQWVRARARAAGAALETDDRQTGDSSIVHCAQKKHSLAFSFIASWKMVRFTVTQHFQGMFSRN